MYETTDTKCHDSLFVLKQNKIILLSRSTDPRYIFGLRDTCKFDSDIIARFALREYSECKTYLYVSLHMLKE